MTTFYGWLAIGSSRPAPSGGSTFMGMTQFVETKAENRAQAFINIHQSLSSQYSDVTALQSPHHELMLGFTPEELKEISKANIRIKEGFPTSGAQIQAIRDTPFV